MTAGRALYLYAVVPDGVRFEIVQGIDDEATEVVRGEQLGVVVSEVDLGILAQVNGAQDAEGLGVLARRHDTVVREAAAAADAVLPFRLGTVVSDRDAARQYLDSGADVLLPALRRVQGCGEWSVTVHGDSRGRPPSPADAHPPTHEDLAAPGAGTAYLRRRRRELGRLDELRRAKAQAGEDVAHALRAHAVDVTAGRARAHDALLCETYLVRRAAEAAFLAEVGRCESCLAEFQLSLELTGPWPPYSFAPGFVMKAGRG